MSDPEDKHLRAVPASGDTEGPIAADQEHNEGGEVESQVGEVDGHLVSAEISGNVWKLLVEEGASVEAGQTLVIVEAMKMEFEITASVAGTVTGLHCKPGTVINAGDPVVVIDTESAA